MLTRIPDEKKIKLVVQYAKGGSKDVMDLVDDTAKAQLEHNQIEHDRIVLETRQQALKDVGEWLPALIKRIEDEMWTDDWGVKGVLYTDMLEDLVKPDIKALKRGEMPEGVK